MIRRQYTTLAATLATDSANLVCRCRDMVRQQITLEQTSFDYVRASLSPKVADLIPKPPEATPYKVLKEKLIRRTAASEQCCLQQLFKAEELGDHKPTQQLQQLLGDREVPPTVPSYGSCFYSGCHQTYAWCSPLPRPLLP